MCCQQAHDNTENVTLAWQTNETFDIARRFVGELYTRPALNDGANGGTPIVYVAGQLFSGGGFAAFAAPTPAPAPPNPREYNVCPKVPPPPPMTKKQDAAEQAIIGAGVVSILALVFVVCKGCIFSTPPPDKYGPLGEVTPGQEGPQ